MNFSHYLLYQKERIKSMTTIENEEYKRLVTDSVLLSSVRRIITDDLEKRSRLELGFSGVMNVEPIMAILGIKENENEQNNDGCII